VQTVLLNATITAVDAVMIKHMVDAFHSRRDLVVGLLKEIPGIKSMFQKVLLCIS
jgi:aspartate aminotransferase